MSFFPFRRKKNKFFGVEVTKENIRSLVLLQMFDDENDDPFTLYHENDIVKVKSNDYLIDRFIKNRGGGSDGDHDDMSSSGNGLKSSLGEATDAMKIVKSILHCTKWRKNVGINDLYDESFPKKFIDSGSFSTEQLDNGNTILYVDGHGLISLDGSTDMWTQFFIHCIELLDNSIECGNKILVVLDVSLRVVRFKWLNYRHLDEVDQEKSDNLKGGRKFWMNNSS